MRVLWDFKERPRNLEKPKQQKQKKGRETGIEGEGEGGIEERFDTSALSRCSCCCIHLTCGGLVGLELKH
jgi:hypothetical protein